MSRINGYIYFLTVVLYNSLCHSFIFTCLITVSLYVISNVLNSRGNVVQLDQSLNICMLRYWDKIIR